MQYHAPSGLYLTKYRVYDPNEGRWLSRDPIGAAGGINLSAYVGGNPVSFVDPLGLATVVVVDTAGFGHASVLVGDPSGLETRALYDPNGGYRYHQQQRPSGDLFYGHDFSFYDYIVYQIGTSSDPPEVYVYIFDTTLAEETIIKKRMEDQGGGGFFGCVSSTSGAIGGIGPFSDLGWNITPSGVKNALDSIVTNGTGQRLTGQEYLQANPYDAAGVESLTPIQPPLTIVPPSP
jgi:RHS repeat-associated protein